MHHHQLLILFALLIFAFGSFSRIAERKSITGPMVFMTVGILGSSLLFGFLHVTPEMGPVKLVAELALTLVLFIDEPDEYEEILKTIDNWNVYARSVRLADGTPTAAGRPLVFFHFSGFDPLRPEMLSRHQNRLLTRPVALPKISVPLSEVAA